MDTGLGGLGEAAWGIGVDPDGVQLLNPGTVAIGIPSVTVAAVALHLTAAVTGLP